MTDEYLVKLNQLLERMTAEQVRQVLRFAQFIYEDQEPENTLSYDDPANRTQEFAQWAQSVGLDLGEMNGWSGDTAGRTTRPE